MSLAADPAALAGARTVERDLRFGERVLVMRQLALMLRAGVPLLEALGAVTVGVEAARGRRQFEAVAAALRQGETFAAAMATRAPGFPSYLQAMLEVGQSSGRLGDVLQQAADQMAYEDRLRRDLINALIYPAFLAAAGVAAIVFILTQIAPRFAAIIGDHTDRLPLLSRLILRAGGFLEQHGWSTLIVIGLASGLAALAANRPATRVWLYGFARRMPAIGPVLRAREIAIWARLTSFAMSHGVGLLPATALALETAPQGPFRASLTTVEMDLRAGLTFDQSLARGGQLTPMDLGLLRAGQRSGALGPMLAALADSYDDRLRDGVKRLTALVEPLAIAGIAIVVSIVAFALVTTLSAVYDLAS